MAQYGQRGACNVAGGQACFVQLITLGTMLYELVREAHSPDLEKGGGWQDY